jgi:hypothetical protein
MCQTFGTTSLAIDLDHKGIFSIRTPNLSCPLLQILQVISCRFLLPGPHVGTLSLHPSVLFLDQMLQQATLVL